MKGTLRITENRAHTWIRGAELGNVVSRFEKQGTVDVKSRRPGEPIKIRVQRWDGSVFKGVFYADIPTTA